MRRRHFLAVVGAVPLAALAQPARVPRIGWISYTATDAARDAFTGGLAALGYAPAAVDIVARVVEPNAEKVRAAVDELVATRATLIVAVAAIGPAAHRAAEGRIPIVFAFSGDPVVAGLVQSFARPGGTSTGMSFMALELVGKRLELMQALSPSLRDVVILANPQHPGEPAEHKASLEAASRLDLRTVYVPILPNEPPEAAFERIRATKAKGIIVFQDAGMVARAARIAQFALQHGLLAVSGWAQFAHAGFVATYGPNLSDAYRRLAVYVDRVLKGTRPDALPVELPTRLELVLNLRTAAALGLAIPRSLRERADEVIQ